MKLPATAWSRIVYLPLCYPKIDKFKIYRTTILPVLHGCEPWSLTLREEHRLSEFENRVLRKFWPKRDKVTVD
jgi:hypothetical protein